MVLLSLFAKRYSKLLFLFISLVICLPGYARDPEPVPAKFSYAIVSRYPHDASAFTQGLVWDQDKVYEGTGLFGRSSLRRVDLRTGAIQQVIEYEKHIFAEGITVFQNKIYQLTWKNNVVFAYDQQSFSLIKTWPLSGEGWGLTHDGRNLIMSDGTAALYFLDPDTMNEKRRITVHDQTGPIHNLNELEYIKGLVYANIWKSNRIAMIDPGSGRVVGWIDLSGLQDSLNQAEQQDVLNGIMYDAEDDRLFVTGKLWPTLFEIRLKPDL
jgi:glutamine cyclotransferase